MLDLFPQAQPVQGLIGGVLIGLAGAIMLLGVGRIAGVSGLAARALGLSSSPPWPTAALFIAGLPLGALLVAGLTDGIPARFPQSNAILIVAGLVTGLGTRMGSGCTSGHGVCGVSRLSRRSIVATVSFMASGMVTVALVNAFGGGW
ncbi:YeeE/YedE family protein [Novosphingobium aquimarinum]|uniref:YeeE/YedE family protein n=1 Tax=Novosphingobium aquimarinum TaxID=2682494 RepID=UPI0012EB29C5|nr:YeeE/YedE thiosulfate transporter family protein [Novosphingobium aquimarinum]